MGRIGQFGGWIWAASHQLMIIAVWFILAQQQLVDQKRTIMSLTKGFVMLPVYNKK